ncbi:MAG: hypothetical protein ACD_10C00822G0002 [uncultured bacterium]|nr:MAG: hypothetical protein ACD_10C00822G0002 [uncultured bacterium]
MRIQESSVELSASHQASRVQTLEVHAEQGFRQIFKQLAVDQSEQQADAQARVQQLLQSLIEAILAAMDGKKGEAKFAAGPAVSGASTPAADEPEITWQRSIRETVCESEKTTVCGNGKVKTTDGKVIEFNYSLAMAREFRSATSAEESGRIKLRDPLMLSFNGQACELTHQRMAFDLNGDGSSVQIPGLGAASAFLVFDRNGNGKADDGSELFGVASGNGFADLAQLDSDDNGWIDQADSAFNQLALWFGDGFKSLQEQGVGALYTAAVDAPFSLKTSTNELLGQIRSAGFYLSESGELGAMQQVDLAVAASSPGREEDDAEFAKTRGQRSADVLPLT